MITWLIALLVALIIGGVASTYVRTAKRKWFEPGAGLDALKALHLREFSHFALDAMKHRGFNVDPNATLEHAIPSDRILVRGDTRWLLTCRHGKAEPVTAKDVRKMIDVIRLKQVGGGILVTLGEVEDEALAAAKNTRLELVHGPGLWAELAPYLPETMRQEVSEEAAGHGQYLLAATWGTAIALGVAAFFVSGIFLQKPDQATTTLSAASKAPLQTQPDDNDKSQAAANAGPDKANATTPQSPSVTAPKPPVQATQTKDEDQAREEVQKAVSDLAGVNRAVWSSQSTLLVHLQDENVEPIKEICAVMQRYPALVISRIQLQPPPGSETPVRFRQCHIIWGND